MFRSSIIRAVPRASNITSVNGRAMAAGALNATRNSSSYAVSSVQLTDIEKRWEGMPPQEQAELWMALRDRMKGEWKDLTMQEKKASYYIAFGPHGPRAVPPPGEGKKVFIWTVVGCVVSFVAFYGIRLAGKGSPKTMTKEWQEASNELLKEQKIEPLTGFASEGYKGSGMVQSN